MWHASYISQYFQTATQRVHISRSSTPTCLLYMILHVHGRQTGRASWRVIFAFHGFRSALESDPFKLSWLAILLKSRLHTALARFTTFLTVAVVRPGLPQKALRTWTSDFELKHKWDGLLDSNVRIRTAVRGTCRCSVKVATEGWMRHCSFMWGASALLNGTFKAEFLLSEKNLATSQQAQWIYCKDFHVWDISFSLGQGA